MQSLTLMFSLVVNIFFLNKSNCNVLYSTATKIAKCAVNNEEIKLWRPECIKSKCCRVNVSKQIQTEKNNKNKYVVCCKVSKAKLVLIIKAQRWLQKHCRVCYGDCIQLFGSRNPEEKYQTVLPRKQHRRRYELYF